MKTKPVQAFGQKSVDGEVLLHVIRKCIKS